MSFEPIKPSLKDAFSKPTGADKADQTELSRWPDQSSSSRSNRASKTLLSKQHSKPFRPIKPSFEDVSLDYMEADKANQTNFFKPIKPSFEDFAIKATFKTL
ncbi:hypothetical protein JCGZ_07859 [Jatropha curcas]|uniref:Uncharacterized protein n=1 Tax=Jatropha curcas TaxID=180498 RepID=A0A067KNE3_JATCU|nr:hypothetical protein JCGZ_07859 [Jatropha curcas]